MNAINIFDVKDKKPSFTNQMAKFWLLNNFDYEIKKYNLKNVFVFYVEHSEGYKDYLITQNNTPIFNSQQLDGISSYLHVLKMINQ